ncbi:MAG: helix-turn-helix domain-containing protein [Lysobacterales bacterium]
MNRDPAVGLLLRDWRQRRRRSQLDLAADARISTRHLSFVETGRSRPSREVILELAAALDLPLRERNRLLLAGGYAPQFAEQALNDAPMQAARQAVQSVLDGHEPFPALAVDRHWNLLLSNRSAERLLQMVSPELLVAPVNVLKVSLHPQGLAPAVINLGEWRRYLLARLQRLCEQNHDPQLLLLREELTAYPSLPGEGAAGAPESVLPDVMMVLRLRSPVGDLALFGTLTVFGSPTEITLSELALEAFYPADPTTADRLRQLAALD